MDKKLQNLAKVGTVNITDDSGKLQTAQVSIMANELSDNVPVFQDYGLTSNPRPKSANGQGAEALVLALNGNSSRRTIIKRDDRRYRPRNLASGDVALYTHLDTPTVGHTSATHRIALSTSGSPSIIARSSTVDIDASTDVSIASAVVDITATGAADFAGSAVGITGTASITGTAPAITLTATGALTVSGSSLSFGGGGASMGASGSGALTMNSPTSITLTVGSSSITITSSTIDIDATTVNINGVAQTGS